MQRDIGIHMKGGVITERDTGYRTRAPPGTRRDFTTDQPGHCHSCKEIWNGEVHSTTRQTLEIPHIKRDSLKKLEKP